RARPRTPAEAAEALRAAAGARAVLLGDARGETLAMAPAGALDPNAPAARAAAEALRAAARGDGPMREDARGPLAAALSAPATVALRAAPAGARRALGALIVAPDPALDEAGDLAWPVLERAAEPLGADLAVETPGLGDALRRRAAPLIAAALLTGAMFLPWPDRIRAEAELQPLSRRYVAASFEAVLRELRVEVGDVVAEGDVIAALDGEELRLRRRAAAARAEEALRRRDAELREGRIAAAELARLDAEAALAEADLLDWRLAR
ncbi:MAG: biotin/lipoyl-binding protein, partial [Pseudomonadota bacterium]